MFESLNPQLNKRIQIDKEQMKKSKVSQHKNMPYCIPLENYGPTKCLIVSRITILLLCAQSYFSEAELTTFAFRSGEVKKLLLELDPYGGAGPDGIFLLFFVKIAYYLAPKVSTVLRKLVRIGGFSMCWRWRVGNITPVPKSGSTNSCPSDYRPITITPVLSKFFERLLAKRLNNFDEKKNL